MKLKPETRNAKIKVRNLDVEYQWAEYLTKMQQKSAENTTIWDIPGKNKYIQVGDGSILFSDDTGICVNNINDFPPKIEACDKIIKKQSTNKLEQGIPTNK